MCRSVCAGAVHATLECLRSRRGGVDEEWNVTVEGRVEVRCVWIYREAFAVVVVGWSGGEGKVKELTKRTARPQTHPNQRQSGHPAEAA